MIRKVHIKNFKTLKDLAFPCTRMNLFIGDTNTGKSNILEALTLLSRGAVAGEKYDQRLIRYDDLEDLFPLRDLSEPIVVDTGDLKATLAFDHGQFQLSVAGPKPTKGKQPLLASSYMDHRGSLHDRLRFQFDTRIRRYHFIPDLPFGPNTQKELEAPYGSNFPGLLAANKELRTNLSGQLEGTGVRLAVKLKEASLHLSLLSDENVVVELPYRNLSDTLKRYMFMYAILETVKGFVLLLDEPEQNTFPMYTKHMAEMMAMDNGNQYFITTHNAYLFRSVVEKTKAKDLSVFITHLDEEGVTCLKKLNGKELARLLDMDIFFNLRSFIQP